VFWPQNAQKRPYYRQNFSKPKIVKVPIFRAFGRIIGM